MDSQWIPSFSLPPQGAVKHADLVKMAEKAFGGVKVLGGGVGGDEFVDVGPLGMGQWQLHGALVRKDGWGSCTEDIAGPKIRLKHCFNG